MHFSATFWERFGKQTQSVREFQEWTVILFKIDWVWRGGVAGGGEVVS